MLGKLKLTRDEVHNRPWAITDRIEKIIRGKEERFDVKFKTMHGSGMLFHPPISGVSIETYDAHDRYCTYRRVKVIFTKDRKYEIDLDKIKAKYEELKKLAEKYKAKKEALDKQEKETDKLISKLEDGLENIDVIKHDDFFTIKIHGLTEKKVKEVVAFIKTLKK